MRNSLAIFALLVVAFGCRSQSTWTETTLGEGKYHVSVPSIRADFGATNEPTLYIAECGRLWVETHPRGEGLQGETWVNWMDGSTSGSVSWSNATRWVTFNLGPVDGAPPGGIGFDGRGGKWDVGIEEASTGDTHIATFTIWTDGTNAFFSLNRNGEFNPKPEYSVVKDASGVFRLRNLRDK